MDDTELVKVPIGRHDDIAFPVFLLVRLADEPVFRDVPVIRRVFF